MPGNAFLIRPGELIDYYSDKNNIWSYIWLGVEGNSAEEFFFRYGFDEFNYVLPLTGVDELRAIIADMLSRPETNAPDLYTVAKTYEFLSCFASKISTFKRKSKAKYSDNLNKVVEYIHRNYYRCLLYTSLEGACSEFGKDSDFSPFYADGIIAIDGCTAFSGKVNCIVLEDENI